MALVMGGRGAYPCPTDPVGVEGFVLGVGTVKIKEV
jgi:hypothetical protein